MSDRADPAHVTDGDPAPTDEELARRVQHGDLDALAVLVDRYSARVNGMARHVCGNSAMAEDVVQEVFIAFWSDPHRFDPSRRFGSWLLTVAHHKSVDAVRRESTHRRRTVLEPAEHADPGHVPGADLAAADAVAAEQVRQALTHLPPEQREAIVLTYYGGYTQQEVAAMTDVPIGTVKSRMFTAVRRLRTALGPTAGPDAGGGGS